MLLLAGWLILLRESPAPPRSRLGRMASPAMSNQADARKAIKEALELAKAGKEQPGISASALEMTTEQLRAIARSMLDEWTVRDRWKIESRDHGLLFFVPLPNVDSPR